MVQGDAEGEGMMNQIKNLWDGTVICAGEGSIRALLSEVNIKNLNGADLKGADLKGADLKGADLRGADLRDADLRGAKIVFYIFPSIRLLSSIELGTLSNDLTTELFRRDMESHPHPELFEVWANNNGACPYKNEERYWYFELRKECFKLGKPTMRDSDLILAICKEMGWKIKGYLE